MAIAFDAATANSSVSSVTSYSFNHTATGSNLVMVMFAFTNIATQADIVTSMTYNSVGATRIATQVITGYQNSRLYAYGLIAPATGTNSATVNLNTADFPEMYVTTYTGAAQSGLPDASTSSDSAGATVASLTETLTTIANNSWLVGVARSNTGIIGGSTNATSRATVGLNGITADSNAAITPAGSTTQVFTSSGANALMGAITVSVAPFVASTANFGNSRMLLGVGT